VLHKTRTSVANASTTSPIVINWRERAIGDSSRTRAFDVTRHGESRRIEIVGAAPNVSDVAKDDLVSVIKRSRFRPRVTDGELARVSPVAFRYYLPD